jgi:hypothetical protein
MRVLALLLSLFVAFESSAQSLAFTPPSESKSISTYGIHFDALQGYPGDRWTAFSYGESGAIVANLQSLTVPIIYGLVDAALGGDALDPDAQPDIEDGRDLAASGFVDIWVGRTFIATPYGEFGGGFDAGLVLLDGTEPIGTANPGNKTTNTSAELVAQAGPNVLYTVRPLENLHVVAHASYQFLALSDVIDGGRTVFDLQGYYRLNSGLGVFGGLHFSAWESSVRHASQGLTLGVAFVPMWQQF